MAPDISQLGSTGSEPQNGLPEAAPPTEAPPALVAAPEEPQAAAPAVEASPETALKAPEKPAYEIPDITFCDPNNRKIKVITIGAGVSGILMAYQIQKQCQK